MSQKRTSFPRALLGATICVFALAACSGKTTTIGVPGNDQLKDPNATPTQIVDSRERMIEKLEAEKAAERQRLLDHSLENRHMSARASQKKIDLLQRRIDRLRAPEQNDIPALDSERYRGNPRSINSIDPPPRMGPMEKQFD